VVKAVYRCLREAEHRSTAFVPYWQIPGLAGARSPLLGQRMFAQDLALLNGNANAPLPPLGVVWQLTRQRLRGVRASTALFLCLPAFSRMLAPFLSLSPFPSLSRFSLSRLLSLLLSRLYHAPPPLPTPPGKLDECIAKAFEAKADLDVGQLEARDLTGPDDDASLLRFLVDMKVRQRLRLSAASSFDFPCLISLSLSL
jgi:hypothetical protein